MVEGLAEESHILALVTDYETVIFFKLQLTCGRSAHRKWQSDRRV